MWFGPGGDVYQILVGGGEVFAVDYSNTKCP